jgi:hypothetical protein
MGKVNHETKRGRPKPNPPLVIGKPVPPTSRAELIALHKRNGTLKEFLERMDYGRD